MAILTVSGIGIASKAADQIHIRLNLLAEAPEYGETMAFASQQLQEVQVAVRALGYEKRDLISENYSISTNYHSVPKGENYEQVFAGYRASQSLILKLDKSDAKLNELLNRLSTLSTRPELYLNFAVKQSDDLTRTALERAVQDARDKALILCRAVEKEPGRILAIRYPAETGAPITRFEKSLPMASGAVDMSMEAAEFEVQLQVEIQYEILDKSEA